MDPVSALAFASSIFATIDFSAKVLTGAYELHKSRSDVNEEIAHVNSIIEDLETATNAIDLGFRGTSSHEVALTKLAKKVVNLSEEISKTLQFTKIQGKRSTWRSITVSWNSTIKAGKIESLTKRVHDFRSEIILQLNLLLVDQTSSVRKYLEKIEAQSREFENETCSRLDDTRTRLEEILSELQLSSAIHQSSRLDDIAETAEVRDSLRALIAMTESVTYENTVLARLYFPSLHMREDAVSEATPHTFHWIVGESRNYNILDGNLSDDNQLSGDSDEGSFEVSDEVKYNQAGGSGDETSELSWERKDYASELEEERVRRRKVSREFFEFLTGRDRIFFVTGKAGCGKSTLLKYIHPSRNHIVQDALNVWASTRQRRLIFIPIYFWAAGDALQRSLEGFYRTLLFQFLRQSPQIMLSLFPRSDMPAMNSFSNHYPFRMPEIMTVMSQITEGLTADNYCLCLFVDGLDEFGGDTVDRLELARLLNQWAKHPNVKILCSARPYPEFLDTFQKSASTIYLHELTKGDISLYSLSTLRQEQKRRLGSESPWTNQHQALIRRIVDRSEGVFIWSRAVVRFLSSKIGHLGPESLASLLEETPQSLYDLYHQMLARRDPMAKRRGNKMLLLAIRYLPEKQLDALAYSWFDKLEDRNFPMNCEPTCYSQTEVEQRIGIVREWLSDGTAGLLEVSCSPIYRMSYHSFFVQPLHRTVLDFLVNDWSTTETLSVDPQFLQEDIYWRIALAGLKVCVGMISWHDEEQFIPLCSYLPRTGGLENNDKVPTNELVRFMKEFEAITSHHQDLLDLHYQDLPNSKKPRALSSMLGRFSPETYPMEVLHVPAVNVPASLIHEALFYDHQRYVLHEIATRPRLVAEDGARVNLLFISCLRSDVRFTEKLISAGARYSCTMPVQQLGTSPKSSTYFTVWVVLLRFLSILSQEVMSESSQIWPETMDSGLPPSAFLGSEVYMKVSMILEETLQTQDSDWDAIVLVKEKYIDPSESKPRLTIPEATYIDLESLLEIALCRMAIGPKSFDVDDFTNNLLQEFQERVVSFQAWRARKRSPQQMWHKSLREKVAEYLWSPPTQVPNQVAVAKNTYPRADLEKLRNGQFRVYGIVTKTERFVGGFEIALF